LKRIDHLFVVGAGFSHYAGLPLATDFTEKLLDVEHLKTRGASTLITQFLRKFVFDTFGHRLDSPSESWPHLEDLFTCIDLSANSGHHLGFQYSPAVLRTVRRALISRIFRMLQMSYTSGKKTARPDRRVLEGFLSRVDASRSAFLSMNWDTVIEKGLEDTQRISSFDYDCDALSAHFEKQKKEIGLVPIPRHEPVHILKPHGSINWMYCDACREVFWFPLDSPQRIAAQLFGNRDWEVVKEFTGQSYTFPVLNYNCPTCSAQALGTRLATFSYRKALDFPMHEKTWQSAEKLLRAAKAWIFIGYSLPAADYEFKHLLKCVQLTRRERPELVLVTRGNGAESTRKNYQRFFGPALEAGQPGVFTEGLNDASMDYLHTLSILRR